MKKIYVTDWSLIPLFIGSAFSGVSLHVTDDTLEHEIWQLGGSACNFQFRTFIYASASYQAT